VDSKLAEGEPVFHWPVRVYYEDTDCGGVVYHTGYLRFMERARTEWLRALGYEQSRLRHELGVLFVVRGLQAEYRKPAVLDDELDVGTTVVREGRTRLHFRQSISRVSTSRTLLVEARIQVVCLDARSLRPRAVPDCLPLESLPNGC
jgi:acyl-CoA thioester hydrolase